MRQFIVHLRANSLEVSIEKAAISTRGFVTKKLHRSFSPGDDLEFRLACLLAWYMMRGEIPDRAENTFGKNSYNFSVCSPSFPLVVNLIVRVQGFLLFCALKVIWKTKRVKFLFLHRRFLCACRAASLFQFPFFCNCFISWEGFVNSVQFFFARLVFESPHIEVTGKRRWWSLIVKWLPPKFNSFRRDVRVVSLSHLIIGFVRGARFLRNGFSVKLEISTVTTWTIR